MGQWSGWWAWTTRIVVAAWLSFSSAAWASSPELSLPIECKPGVNCFLQSYVDIDPGPGVLDFGCGRATYNGHTGTDIRLLSEASADDHFKVLAAAPGVVKGVRDGMPDKIARDIGSEAEVKSFLEGRDCGNGVVIDHGDGWETQYCHMRRGSVLVRTGQTIARGAHLGNVGFSGRADFAHVHLSVRHNGNVIDPFTGDRLNSACRSSETTDRALWSDRVLDLLPYQRSQIMMVGFAGEALQHRSLVRDHRIARPDRDSKAIVVFARIINLRKGDRIKVGASGPDGFAVDHMTKPLQGNKADFTVFAGKKLRTARWAPGAYRGTIKILRNGKIFASKDAMTALD